MRLPKALATLSLFACLALVPAPARAAGVGGLHLERADVSAYPLVKLYLTYVEGDGRVVTGKTRDEFKFIFDSNEQGVAADAKPFDQMAEQIYAVIVVQVSGAMADSLEDEKRGVRAIASAAADMKGSKIGLISYASETKRLSELAKPEEIDGAPSAGLALDSEGSEVHLLDSVRTAIDLLNAKTVPDNARKMIIVFSDGLDVSGGEKRAFTELGKKALLANIVIDTIGYAPFEASKLRNLNELAKQSNGTSRECKTSQEVSAQFANVADEVKKQYVVLFQSVINGDGKEHTIQVVNDTGGKPVYSNNITKICENHEIIVASTPFWKKWWFWLLSGIALLVGIGLIVKLLSRNKVDGMEIQQAAPMAAPAPAPGGPQRTMALDLGAITGKGPTVGWIVGVSGKYADQTFKLKAGGRTLIGTAPDSDILIEDTWMSSKHCEVSYNGQTYKIVDLGSTNGIVLNDKKIREGDLVDGDSFKLGRTEFKFKSIN
ncbi:MAG: FHA domain-containing protein [Myxococcales bacterium]|nr:FHA domain-containing protein [Myxococcales bacterium]